jgi:hypothetical protein
MMISAVLIPNLQHRFPGRGLRIGSPPSLCAVFPAVPATEKQRELWKRSLSFLEALFADQIVLWGSHEDAGGWHRRGEYTESKKDATEYVGLDR